MTENAAGTTESAEITPAELTAEQEDVLEAMRDVVDPELGINVVDLGLVYGVDVDAERIATIDMTLTSAACPLTDVIEDQAREALDGVVADFRINWVWMPPWGLPRLLLDHVGERARGAGQRHVQGGHLLGVHVHTVDEAEVDDVDAQLGVDHVPQRLKDVLDFLRQRLLLLGHLRGGFFTHALHPRSAAYQASLITRDLRPLRRAPARWRPSTPSSRAART